MLIDVGEFLKEPPGALLKRKIQISAQKIDNEVRTKKPTVGKVELKRTDKGINSNYKINSTVGLICFRCAEEFEKKISLNFNTQYRLAQADLPQAVFEEEQDEGFFYILPNNKIDPWLAIRQEILLSLPMKILCRKSCRGICLKCGQNLNKNKCRCQK